MKTFQEFILIAEGMTLKDFKKKRSAVKQKEKRAADKIAPTRRAGIHADKASPERAARHRANVDPDFEGNDERNYPGGKLNPKKVRKAKALGELGENVSSGSARRARFGVKQRVSSAEPITNTQRQNKIAQHFSDHATKKKSAGDEAHAAATKAGKSPSDAETARQRAHREYEKQLKRG